MIVESFIFVFQVLFNLVGAVSSIASLIYTTIVVSASGALSPGPLTVATIAVGTKHGWRGGLLVGLGHMIIEFPYIVVLYTFIESMRGFLQSTVGDVIAMLGTSVVVFFAFTTIRESLRIIRSGNSVSIADNIGHRSGVFGHPVAIGALLTGLNIWFLIWWVFIGYGLITMVAEMGFITVVVMFASHIWIDFLWLALVAETGRRGSKLLGSRGYALFLLVLGLVLAVFGLNISLRRFLSISLLP